MTNNSGEIKEITCLSYRLIFHSIIFVLVLITHVIVYLKIYWMKNLIKQLFFFVSFIGVVYILISIIPFILIKIKNLQSRVKHFKIISKIFLFLSLLIGLFFFIIIIINTVSVKDFCIECPFNISFFNFVSNYEKNFENKEEYELKRNCRERRCLFNKYDENSSYPYAYLCNYDPEEEFGVKDGERKQLNCKLFEPSYKDLYFSDETIIKYLDKCFDLTTFYYCGRLEEPKKYELEEDEKCPKKNYIYSIYFLCAYIFIFDVVINIIIWYLQHNSYSLLSTFNFEPINPINSHNHNKFDSTNVNINENNNQNDNKDITNNEKNNNKQDDNNNNDNRNNNNQNNNENIINNRNNNNQNNQNNNRVNNSTRTRENTVLEQNPNPKTILGSTVVVIKFNNENQNQNNEQNNNQNNNNVCTSNMDNENDKKESDRNNENRASNLLLQKNFTSKSDIHFTQMISKSILNFH